MKNSYLEVTFRGGKAFAAYYHLRRGAGHKSVRCRRLEAGLVVDYATDGRPIGIEITAPGSLSLEAFNRVLQDLGQPAATDRDLAPLHAA